MKLTYWMAYRKNDSSCFNVRAKTKKECLRILECHDKNWDEDYEAPKKVVVAFKDSFDLLLQCLEEGRGSWEVSQ
jgi:hypothetical protein